VAEDQPGGDVSEGPPRVQPSNSGTRFKRLSRHQFGKEYRLVIGRAMWASHHAEPLPGFRVLDRIDIPRRLPFTRIARLEIITGVDDEAKIYHRVALLRKGLVEGSPRDG
jgi:hypothetical protein